MTEDGAWILNEPYQSEVNRIKREITIAFNELLFEEVSKISPYSTDVLREEYVRMVQEREQYASDLVTSFIVEAMSGQLTIQESQDSL